MSALAHGFHLPSAGEVAHADAVVQHQLRDVHDDVLGNVRRQTLDDELAVHEVDDAALRLDALGLAGEVHRHGHAQHLVHRDAIEVGSAAACCVTGCSWYVLDQHARVARALELQRDQRVDAGLRMQDPQQRLGVDRDATRTVPSRHRAPRESGPSARSLTISLRPR